MSVGETRLLSLAEERGEPLERARGKHARTTHHTLYCPINSNLLPIAE